MARWGCEEGVLIRVIAILGSWRHLGPSWGHLGAILGRSWGDLGAILGPSWGDLGAILGHFGAILGHLGAILGSSWGLLGSSWGRFGVILELLATILAKSKQFSKMCTAPRREQHF